jgi:ABC-type phosphate transport system substrate-binding protein
MKLVAFGITLGLLASASSVDAQEAPFKVVVHKDNSLRSLPVEAVSDYFLKKKKAWPDGSPVKPVDLSVDSRVRQTFSKSVLKKQVAAVRTFWQRQVFSGSVVPPPEAPSDLVVLAYVAENPGAIGYVAMDAPTGPSIKVVEVVKTVAAK